MTERTGASWFVYALGAAVRRCDRGRRPRRGTRVGQPGERDPHGDRRARGRAVDRVRQRQPPGRQPAQPRLQDQRTVTHIYVSQGQQVAQGQLLATLDPQSAEVTLEQAKASAAVRRSQPRQRGRNQRRRLEPAAPAAGRAPAQPAAASNRLVGAHTKTTPRRPPPPSPPPASRRAPRHDARQADTDQQHRAVRRLVLLENHDQPGHARSEPRLGASGRQERQADRAERRTGRAGHQAVRARERHDRLALRPGRGNGVRQRDDARRERRRAPPAARARARRAPARAPPARAGAAAPAARARPARPPPPAPPAPRSRFSATSARCSWWCR